MTTDLPRLTVALTVDSARAEEFIVGRLIR